MLYQPCPCTVTVVRHDCVFPAPSVAVKVTLVAPAGNILPEGALDTHDVAAGQLSTTTGVSAGAVAVHSPEAALMVRLAGQIIVGANISGEHCDQPAMTLAHKIVIVRKNALTDMIGYLMNVFFVMGHFIMDKKKNEIYCGGGDQAKLQ